MVRFAPALAICVGLAGGALFLMLRIPLPWVLGSIAATALATRFGIPVRTPAGWRAVALLAIGVMLGAGFEEGVFGRLVDWFPSILVMLILSALFFALSYVLQRRLSGMDRATAFLATVPGGFAIVVALADELGADTRRIALTHAARVVVLLLMTPIMFGWVADLDLGGVAGDQLAHLEWGDPFDLAMMAGCAAGGWALSRVVPLPSGALLFPLVLSAALHAGGVVTAHVPAPVSIMAQVVLGAGVGARFSGYRTSEIIRDGWVAAATGVVLGLGAFAGAWAYARATGEAVAPLLLAFMPGGAPELGVVALALNIDPAMVSTHHLSRVMVIAALIGLSARRRGPSG